MWLSEVEATLIKNKNMGKGFMYILECADGSYYTGSTVDLERRLEQHQAGEGSNHTKKRLPVKLLYFEEFLRIDEAFYREKQVQGWSRKKKEALINNQPEELHELAKCLNETHYGGFDSAQPPKDDSIQAPKDGSAQPPGAVPEQSSAVAKRSVVAERSRSHKQMKQSAELDEVIRKNMEALGYGE